MLVASVVSPLLGLVNICYSQPSRAPGDGPNTGSLVPIQR